MEKINWKQKLTSRKLWTAVVGVVIGLAAAFGLNENEYAQVAGIVTSAISVLAYIFGETKVDATRLETEGISKIVEATENGEVGNGEEEKEKADGNSGD